MNIDIFNTSTLFRRVVTGLVLVAFLATSLPGGYAQGISLPQPGTMVGLSQSFQPLRQRLPLVRLLKR